LKSVRDADNDDNLVRLGAPRNEFYLAPLTPCGSVRKRKGLVARNAKPGHNSFLTIEIHVDIRKWTYSVIPAYS